MIFPAFSLTYCLRAWPKVESGIATLDTLRTKFFLNTSRTEEESFIDLFIKLPNGDGFSCYIDEIEVAKDDSSYSKRSIVTLLIYGSFCPN